MIDHLAEMANRDLVADFVKRAIERSAKGHGHTHQRHASERRMQLDGHDVVIHVHHRIVVNGHDVDLQPEFFHDGTVWAHLLPYQQFATLDALVGRALAEHPELAVGEAPHPNRRHGH